MDWDKEIKNIRKLLIIKKSGNKRYFYLWVNNPFIKKEYYLGKYTDEDSQLKKYLEVFMAKLITDCFYTTISSVKKSVICNHLTDNQFLDLELLRFAYNILLREFDKSDLEKYEEAIYTKYVFGTTSIEGNTYTLRETELTLNEGITVAGKNKREFYEIENYGKLKRFIDGLSNREITVDLIKEIHKIIMTNIDEGAAGEFRRVQVGIRGTDFTPCPAILVEEQLNKILQWYYKNKEKIYPVEMISVFHQKFEEIHPFSDGNGRVGREIARIMLHELGFPSVFIGPANREAYLKSLDFGNEGDYSSIIRFFYTNLSETHNSLLSLAKDKISKVDITKNPDLDDKKAKYMRKFIEKINRIKLAKDENVYNFE